MQVGQSAASEAKGRGGGKGKKDWRKAREVLRAERDEKNQLLILRVKRKTAVFSAVKKALQGGQGFCKRGESKSTVT